MEVTRADHQKYRNWLTARGIVNIEKDRPEMHFVRRENDVRNGKFDIRTDGQIYSRDEAGSDGNKIHYYIRNASWAVVHDIDNKKGQATLYTQAKDVTKLDIPTLQELNGKEEPNAAEQTNDGRSEEIKGLHVQLTERAQTLLLGYDEETRSEIVQSLNRMIKEANDTMERAGVKGQEIKADDVLEISQVGGDSVSPDLYVSLSSDGNYALGSIIYSNDGPCIEVSVNKDYVTNRSDKRVEAEVHQAFKEGKFGPMALQKKLDSIAIGEEVARVMELSRDPVADVLHENDLTENPDPEQVKPALEAVQKAFKANGINYELDTDNPEQLKQVLQALKRGRARTERKIQEQEARKGVEKQYETLDDVTEKIDAIRKESEVTPEQIDSLEKQIREGTGAIDQAARDRNDPREKDINLNNAQINQIADDIGTRTKEHFNRQQNSPESSANLKVYKESLRNDDTTLAKSFQDLTQSLIRAGRNALKEINHSVQFRRNRVELIKEINIERESLISLCEAQEAYRRHTALSYATDKVQIEQLNKSKENLQEKLKKAHGLFNGGHMSKEQKEAYTARLEWGIRDIDSRIGIITREMENLEARYNASMLRVEDRIESYNRFFMEQEEKITKAIDSGEYKLKTGSFTLNDKQRNELEQDRSSLKADMNFCKTTVNHNKGMRIQDEELR